NVGLGALDFSMHDHSYVASNVPDPARALITFQFASPTVVDGLDVIEHANGITLLHAYVGNSLSAMTDIGAVFGSLGDLTGPGQMFEGEQNVFDFPNSIAGSYFQVVIDRTSLADGYAFYRMFPESTPIAYMLDTTAPTLAITDAGGLTYQAVQTVSGTADVAD